MGFLSDGKKKEIEFTQLKEFHGKDIIFSKENEDMTQHWDVMIDGIKYDVKGLKKIAREDDFVNEFYHTVELKNVDGKLGWLYGEADGFVFETKSYWIIVDKVKLQEFISERISKIFVKVINYALYCLYRRHQRKDAMTIIKTIDLMFLAHQVIEKPSEKIIRHEPGNHIDEKVNLEKFLEKNL